MTQRFLKAISLITKVLNSDGKQYVFRQNTSGNEIDSLLNIESLKFADQEKSGGYTNFTENDTLKIHCLISGND